MINKIKNINILYLYVCIKNYMKNHKNIKPIKLNSSNNTIYYIISDTHFGSHQNSKSWLDDNL